MSSFKLKLVAYFLLLSFCPLVVAEMSSASEGLARRLLVGLLVLLMLVAAAAYLEGRTILRRVADLVSVADSIARGRLDARVAVRGHDELTQLGHSFNAMATELEARVEELQAERARLREAFGRFGEALAATHEPDQLLPAIVETAVEATGASGGVLLGPDGQICRAGDPRPARDLLELPLAAGRASFGTLRLFGERFGSDERMTAATLAAHAAVALENARLHRIVEHQARVDGLTGLPNRRQCEDVLAAELARAERFGGSLAVVIADLDDFKALNDRYGHAAGDAALCEFAAVLRDSVRDVDLACRWGGEEFVLVLPGTDGAGAASVAERVRENLRERSLDFTSSFGVASFAETSSGAELVRRADAALYRAKRAGKDRVEVAEEPLVRR
jgi:diguanylate cyclase (GGDEF)-like protein